jgi:hypothetical protein
LGTEGSCALQHACQQPRGVPPTCPEAALSCTARARRG